MSNPKIHPDHTAWTNSADRNKNTVQMLVDMLHAMSADELGIGVANAKAALAACELLQMQIDVEALDADDTMEYHSIEAE